ncbi:hypothetical protein SDC9_203445 [bioreactor metagenome]|uniref:Uncharacterized protein n=1 Tax=bioreactor metagenome TaxID=1076179 RepID=A0A645IWN8_9ZZZZ
MGDAINTSRQTAGNGDIPTGQFLTKHLPPSFAIPGRRSASHDGELKIMETSRGANDKNRTGIIFNGAKLRRIIFTVCQ